MGVPDALPEALALVAGGALALLRVASLRGLSHHLVVSPEFLYGLSTVRRTPVLLGGQQVTRPSESGSISSTQEDGCSGQTSHTQTF